MRRMSDVGRVERALGDPADGDHAAPARQLTGAGPAEASATIVQRTLAELGIAGDVLLWNVVPTHPGTATSNRTPTRAEIDAAQPFLHEVTHGRTVIAVGRIAASVLDAPSVRHPSRGGAHAFADGLRRMLA